MADGDVIYRSYQCSLFIQYVYAGYILDKIDIIIIFREYNCGAPNLAKTNANQSTTNAN